MATKNVAVIGGAGFIGSHVVDELVSRGNNVLVLDNFVSGAMKNINKKAEWIDFDIRSSPLILSSILRNVEIDEVYHLAAEPYIPESYERPRDFFDVNAIGTMNVLIASGLADVRRVMYWSTSEVYGTGSGKMDETFPLNPQSTYAVSKMAGDRLALTLFKEKNIPVIILRQFNVYGPRETHEYVIPEIISQLSKGDTLMLGNIKAKRDFLYVEDEARMVVELMEKGVPGEVYNLGSEETYSIEYIASVIADVMRREPKIKIDPRRLRPFDVEYLRSDNSKVYRIIKSRPKVNFRDGIKKLVKWFYDNGMTWGFE